jgi:nucleoside-diphosphate-sugar epimerase
MQNKKTVSILGCGWYGLALAKELISNGFSVKGSTTSGEKIQHLADLHIVPYLVNFSADNETYAAAFFDCDVLIISIPPKVRTGNAEDYIKRISHIIDAINSSGIKQVIFISSTGVYSDLNTIVNELTPPIPDTESGKALLKAEEMLKKETSFTTTVIRFAGLIGPGRDPGRFFAGKTNIPNGKAPVNLIHLADCTGISLAILKREAFGYTFNAVSQGHPQKADFYVKAAMRSALPVPEFIDELNDWKIVSGGNVETILNYQYQISDLMNWVNTTIPLP